MGIIGPNGAGKTTLLKALLGLVPLNAGSVHIDDLDIRKITQAIRIDKIGYLPQEIDLFAATIAENIAKLDIANLEEIHAATRLAGVHDAIMQMPRGYETHVDKQNAQVSAGIRQRIGLARAIFGAPSLIVLDEPNSYQDAEGDRALAEILRTAKERRAITVVASHRPLMMPEVDKLCFLVNGEIKLFGPREEVQRKLFAQVSGPGKAPGGIAPPPRGPEQGTPPNGH